MGTLDDAATGVVPPPCCLTDAGKGRCLTRVDSLVQHLVVARMRLERGESEQALTDLDAVISAAQGLATRHVGHPGG